MTGWYPACGGGGGGDVRTIGKCEPEGARRAGLMNPDPEGSSGAVVVVVGTWYSDPEFCELTDPAQPGI